MRHVDRIVSALRSGIHSTHELAKATGKSVESTRVRMSELAKAGIVRAYAMRSDGRKGRMPKHYRLNTQ